MPGPFRKTDAVLTISQDNTRRAIEVSAANEVASALIGIAPEELQGTPFRDIIPARVAEDIDDYVEYIAGANDVGEVLRKMRKFQIKDKDGNAVDMRLKILRHHSQQHDEFLLIMHDEERERQNNAALTALREAFDAGATLNEDTGLPDRSSLLKGLEVLDSQRDALQNGACLAVMELDAYEKILGKYGLAACHKAVAGIAQHCNQNLRGNDYVAQVDGSRLALILVGAQREPAKMVLNRLRWLVGSLKIRTGQGLDVQSTVSIAFNEVGAETPAQEMLARLEKTLDEKPKDSVNIVVEA